MADVYACDDDRPQTLSTTSALFIVVADADPDVLARVTSVVRLGNIAPAAGSFLTREDGTIVISLEIHGLSSATVEYLRRKLEQLSTVHRADAHLMQPKSRGDAAGPHAQP